MFEDISPSYYLHWLNSLPLSLLRTSTENEYTKQKKKFGIIVMFVLVIDYMEKHKVKFDHVVL